ncbi:MAG: asparagine synthase (glutamine-hydrolyzing) [Eggerthellaceae bacterium]|nr:asparagine synthase (glutamine-hydrolyzing) [Eggerthellaceae bacterium]
MCGICGFTGAIGNEKDHATLKAMCDVMAHRGPDGEGRYVADGIALGHRRLSLIDLEGGGQPIVRATGDLHSEVWSPAISFDHVRGDGATVADDVLAPACKRGRYVIVFNGEIYNYRELRRELQEIGYEFTTDSDTEVLLVGYIAWSEGVLQRLRGMFAFAIYDAQTRHLFCARDFFGIKPFYYAVQNGQFIFASEIKSILEHPAYTRELNENALAQYLCFQFSALHETFFKGIFKLQPGHWMRVGADGATETHRYWMPTYHFDEHRCERDTIETIDQVVRESVRYHNVADVEVGSFLSSGIDSSYLAACLTEENSSIKTFTVGFSEYQGERDEISWAQELAQMLQVENDCKHITEDEYWQVLPLVQWHMDEPSADPSAVALYFVDQIAARRVKAVLSGEGADEFFGGYRIYQAPLASEHMGMVPKPLLRAGSKMLRAAGKRGANYLERASEGVEDWYYTNANGVAFTPDERDRVLSAAVLQRLATMASEDVRDAIGLNADSFHAESCNMLQGATLRKGIGEETQNPSNATIVGIPAPQQLAAPVYAEATQLDEVTRMQYVDLWFWLVGDILLKTDKMSMAHSLESRVPFLDREVFALAATIPTRQKVNEHQTKITLRQAAERTIPHDWAQKEKLGFPVPVASWLREDAYYERMKREFTSPEAARFFDCTELVHLLDEHRSSAADNSRRIWIIYSFLLWYKVFFIDQMKPE